MPRNKMDDLRNHLFETLEALKDEEKPMDLNRAKAVCEVAQVLVNTAKVEIDFLNAIDSSETSEFFGATRILENDGRGLAAAKAPRRLSA